MVFRWILLVPWNLPMNCAWTPRFQSFFLFFSALSQQKHFGWATQWNSAWASWRGKNIKHQKWIPGMLQWFLGITNNDSGCLTESFTSSWEHAMTSTCHDPPVRIGSATSLRTRCPEGPRPVQKQGAARYLKECPYWSSWKIGKIGTNLEKYWIFTGYCGDS